MNAFQVLLKPTHFRRVVFFLVFDIVVIIAALYFSFFLRFEFVVGREHQSIILSVLPLFIITKMLALSGFGIYRITWRYVGIGDMCNIVNAIVVAQFALIVLILFPLPKFAQFNFLPRPAYFPRSIFLIDAIISVAFISVLRISKRLYLEVLAKKRHAKKGKRTIVIGAGNTGDMIIRDMIKQGASEFYPVAMLDDDQTKIGASIHGIKVCGATAELKNAIVKYRAEAVIIAIPSLDYKHLRNIYNQAKEFRIATIKIVPRIYDFHKPGVNLKSLEEIKIEDLIGRQTVEVNHDEIEEFLHDKTILITGAGGSIGSEITLQVCAFGPRKIILFDIDETALHNMSVKAKRAFPDLDGKIYFVVGDIRDKNRVEEVLGSFRPEIVFHAAAYKHVPMMEFNPKEAVKVNIFGTYNLSEFSVKYGVRKFIMISTDKAVMPTSIMGATKRIAEYICKAFDGHNEGKTRFISVRFGNVLGSRGSVLPLFLEQLKYGGPLTVTHPDMQRYFMTIPEAVSLVLQASVVGKGGEVLVLDMGEPVKIVELAEELIRIHGMEPYRDIDVEFVGIRPGEKLFEEILTAEEGTVASRHEKIFVARNCESYSRAAMREMIKEFETAAFVSNNGEQIKRLLRKYVKHFE